MNINNCNKEDFMEDLTVALGKLEDGGTRDTGDIISDDELFKQPPPKEDCPICLLRLPLLGYVYKSCCGKIICCGCRHAPVKDNLGNTIIEEKCPFCRTPTHESDEEYNEWLQKRVEVGDAEAIFTLGCYYRDALDGFPQDDVKAFELFVRAGDLGHTKAYCNVGYAYEIGRGVDIDEKKAKYYYELAAMGGEAAARHYLGAFEELDGNHHRAIKHWVIAAGGGDHDSLKAMQGMYTDGHATKDDYTKALKSYQVYLDEIKSDQRDKVALAGEKYKYIE